MESIPRHILAKLLRNKAETHILKVCSLKKKTSVINKQEKQSISQENL